MDPCVVAYIAFVLGDPLDFGWGPIIVSCTEYQLSCQQLESSPPGILLVKQAPEVCPMSLQLELLRLLGLVTWFGLLKDFKKVWDCPGNIYQVFSLV